MSKQMRPSQFAVIKASADILRPVQQVWSAIGAYGDAGRFLDIACELVAGNGEIGSVRLIGNGIVEVMVGRSQHSYTYVQTEGPMAAFTYHGCVDLRMASAMTSRLLYTVSYDQTDMDQARRREELERITNRFAGAVDVMKRLAEAAA